MFGLGFTFGVAIGAVIYAVFFLLTEKDPPATAEKPEVSRASSPDSSKHEGAKPK